MDETSIAADLPSLRIELLHRALPEQDAEQITIDIRATPSFEALGRTLSYGLLPMMATANPALVWMRMVEAAWRPWLDVLRLSGPGRDQAVPTTMQGDKDR
ncbi:MAG: hypothetical protein OEM59_14590 [Rhodospirillales bacterium]|nr:hypothetical protein [Rhodospirillales bacterium]